MARHSADLQRYNNDLAKCLEELYVRRSDLQKQIEEEEKEKEVLELESRQVLERLGRVSASLAKKLVTRDEFDRVISDTETAYKKIVDSSLTLLDVLRREVIKEKST